MHLKRTIAAVMTTGAMATTALLAQGRGGASWTTNAGDAQRTSWVRTDPKISKESMAKPGFQLLWKLKLERAPRQLNSLTAPITIASIGYGFRGIKALAFLGGSSENVYGVDYELGRLEWTTHLNYSSIVPPASSSWGCPGGLIAAPTRPTTVAPPAPGAAAVGAGGGRGGGGRATSAVGEPGRGAATIGQGRGAATPAGAPVEPGAAAPAGGGRRGGQAAAPAGGAPAPGAAGAPAASGQRGNAPPDAATAPPAGRGGGRGNAAGGLGTNPVVAVASDGFVHVFNPQNGAETIPPVEFLPPNAAAAGGLILADNVLYAAIGSGCGGVNSGVWAVDLTSADKRPVSWKAGNGSGVVGTAGPALGSNGTVYVAVGGAGSALVSLEPKTLRQQDSFSQDAADFKSSPVVFPYKDRDLIAAAGGDGKVYLLDSASLGGADHKTPLSATPQYGAAGFAAGALASWQSADGTRWVLAPTGRPSASAKFPAVNGVVTNGAIAAFKVTEQNGRPALEPAWISRDMTSPLPPIVVNGVVFALSSGESRGATSVAAAVQRSVPAVLYALDGVTGKTLWSSGTTVTSFAHSGGLAASTGQIYFVTYDGTLWAFGMPTERE